MNWISNKEMVWHDNKTRNLKKLNLSSRSNLNEMIIVTRKNYGNQVLKNLTNKANFKEVIVMVSICCKIALISRGESDIYIYFSLPGERVPKDWYFAKPNLS